jgi:uncharacterized protein (TIGR00251 family)
MVAISEHPEGWVVAVRAQPGARRNGVVGEQAGSLKVAVTAPAQDGRANKAIVEVLREALGVKRSQLELIAGDTHRNKSILVRDLTRAELEKRISALL